MYSEVLLMDDSSTGPIQGTTRTNGYEITFEVDADKFPGWKYILLNALDWIETSHDQYRLHNYIDESPYVTCGTDHWICRGVDHTKRELFFVLEEITELDWE